MSFARPLTLPVFFILASCSPRYAIIAVSTVDKSTNQPIYSKIYSGNNAQYLGDTPALNYLVTKQSLDRSKTLCLIAEADQHQTKWQIVRITKWSKSPSAARDVTMLNSVLFLLPTVN